MLSRDSLLVSVCPVDYSVIQLLYEKAGGYMQYCNIFPLNNVLITFKFSKEKILEPAHFIVRALQLENFKI
jgi:hypothetical protein